MLARGRPGSRLSCQDWGSQTAALPTSALLSLPLPLTAHTCTHLHAHTCAHIRLKMHTRARTHARVHTHTYTHVHTPYRQTFVHTRTCLQMHTRACTHARVHTHTCTHVHTLAQRHSCTHACAYVHAHVSPGVHTRVHRQTWFLPTAAPPGDTIHGNTYWGHLGVCLQALLPSLSSHGSRPNLSLRAGV